jgi:hypothetical protein
MKLPCLVSLILALAFPAMAAAPSKSQPVKGKTGTPAVEASNGAIAKAASAPATPAATTTPANTLTLAAYLQALGDGITLSKDEKTDISAYYLEDGTKLQQILNDASLSPLQQTAQVDDLRDTRNAKIEALLRDVDRQAAFEKIEVSYRVALIELAANGGLVPATTPPNVPQPTATPPAKAEKTEIPGSPPQDSSIKKS